MYAETEIFVDLIDELKPYLSKWKMEGDTLYLWFREIKINCSVIPQVVSTIMETNPDECWIDVEKQGALRLWWD